MKLYKRKPDDRAPLGQPDPYMIKAGDGRYYILSLIHIWYKEGII